MLTPTSHPHRPAADLSQFYVITVISNPVRFKSRYELYWRFKDMCEVAGVKLITVEQAFGERPFMVTEPSNPLHVQVRSVEELWLKENLINIGIRRATTLDATKFPAARKVAWVDADVRPARTPRDWFEEIWHQLQHYEYVQMLENLVDLDLNFNPIGAPQPGFMANYVKYGTPDPKEFKKLRASYPYGAKLFGRPGLAWAANIDALNKVGGATVIVGGDSQESGVNLVSRRIMAHRGQWRLDRLTALEQFCVANHLHSGTLAAQVSFRIYKLGKDHPVLDRRLRAGTEPIEVLASDMSGRTPLRQICQIG